MYISQYPSERDFCVFLVHESVKKELGQHPAILTLYLVTGPY